MMKFPTFADRASLRRGVRRYATRTTLLAHTILTTAAITACGNEKLAAVPAADLTTVPWSVKLNVNVATMSTVAPYNTLQLTATVYNAYGTALTTDTAPTFVTRDPDRISVTADGLVTVKKTGTDLQIVARYRSGAVTLTDTLRVDATSEANPAPLTDFSIDVIPYDRSDIFSAVFLPESVLQATFTVQGRPPTQGTYRYRLWSSNEQIAYSPCCGSIGVVRPGTVTFYATTTVYGVTKTDSVRYDARLSNFLGILIQSDATTPPWFSVPSYVVRTGATVAWLNLSDLDSTDITFDDPTNVEESPEFCQCGSGNVAMIPAGQFAFAARRFPVTGTYIYRSRLHNIQGRIIVRDE